MPWMEEWMHLRGWRVDFFHNSFGFPDGDVDGRLHGGLGLAELVAEINVHAFGGRNRVRTVRKGRKAGSRINASAQGTEAGRVDAQAQWGGGQWGGAGEVFRRRRGGGDNAGGMPGRA